MQGYAVDKATLELQGAVSPSSTVVLRAGVYHGCDGAGNVCALGAAQSGLTIMNYPNEGVTISGGQPLAVAAAAWKRVSPPPTATTLWKTFLNGNDVVRACSSTSSSATSLDLPSLEIRCNSRQCTRHQAHVTILFFSLDSAHMSPAPTPSPSHSLFCMPTCPHTCTRPHYRSTLLHRRSGQPCWRQNVSIARGDGFVARV